jgi:hypothetical protein
MEIDRSESQSSNADLQRIETRQPDSNVNCERLLHLLKQDLEIISTDAGMQIDSRREQLANADWPRIET